MRFPNGYGSITHLSGNRRRPWAVRKTIEGHQKYLAFFATYQEALTFLVDYNKNPTIFSASELTIDAIYHLEMREHRKTLAPITAKNYDIAYAHCSAIKDKPIRDVKVSDLQAIIHQLSMQHVGHATQKKVRQVFHNIYRYAVKYQIIPPTSDISRFVDIDLPQPKYKKTPFNVRQLNRVKAIADDQDNPLSRWAKCVVMMCYSGPRPSEFLHVLKDDVKLRKRCYRIRHSKTAAGCNRLVPISVKVIPYFEYWMNQPGKTLIADADGHPLTYHQFLRLFQRVMEASRCHHTPHECRHTCATWLDDKGANKLSIKKILGHATTDVTDGVYTHKSLRELKKAIDLL